MCKMKGVLFSYRPHRCATDDEDDDNYDDIYVSMCCEYYDDDNDEVNMKDLNEELLCTCY